MEEVKEVALGNSKFGLNLYKIIKKGGWDKSFLIFQNIFLVFLVKQLREYILF